MKYRYRQRAGLLLCTLFTFLLLTPFMFKPTTPTDTFGEGERPPIVYLTFDDGPSHNTERVLDVLKAADVRATFFVVGKAEPYARDLYHRIHDEGHALGLHSFSHHTNVIYKSLKTYMDDFHKLEDWLIATVGYAPKITRMPGGSNTKLCSLTLRKEILSTLAQDGYACFDWDIDPKDCGSYALNAKELERNVIRQAEKRVGEDLVILMHDDALRTTLPDALPGIIAFFKEKGYRFEVIQEDLEILSRRN